MGLLLCLNIAFPLVAYAQEIHESDENAVRIISYFMVGQDYAPEANIRLSQFEAQLETISAENFTVLPLPDAIKSWQTGNAIPQIAIALTFDGGHRSILTQAAPLLEKFKTPYTVFIDPARADIGAPQYLGWRDIKKLKKSGLVTIGLHPNNYGHFTSFDDFTKYFNSARARFREKTGEVPLMLAYPYGEFNEDVAALLKDQKIIALSQNSGVANKTSPLQAIPRFTMTEDYADEVRFRMILNSYPLPASDILPIVSIAQNNSAIGFSSDLDLSDLRCYSSNDGIIPVQTLDNYRAEIRVSKAAPFDRHRINCTLQHDEDSTRWLGFLLISQE